PGRDGAGCRVPAARSRAHRVVVCGCRCPGLHRSGRTRGVGAAERPDLSADLGVPPARRGGTMSDMARLDYAELNSTIRYVMFSVFSVGPARLGDDLDRVKSDAADVFKSLEDSGVVVRGVYDVSGLGAAADFMIWWHAAEVEAIQAAYQRFRRETLLGRAAD